MNSDEKKVAVNGSNVEGKGDTNHGGELRNTFILSGSFFAIYTSYLAIQNLQSSLNQEAGLGVVSLAILYGTIIISGILTPTFIGWVGAKVSLIVAWCFHTIYTLSNFYPTWGTLIPSSILLGLIAGPMWTSQGLYITSFSTSYASFHGETQHSILSRFNGIFFTLYEMTQISGNLISSVVLRQSTYNVSAFNGSGNICGADDCPQTGNATVIAEPERYVVYILLGIYLVFDVIGMAITVVFLPNLKKTKTSKKKAAKSLVACFTTLGNSKMFLLIPFLLFQAMEQAVLLSEFTKSYVSCAIGVQNVGFVMAAYGTSTALSALVFGRYAKYIGRFLLYLFGCAINVGILIGLYFFKPEERYFVWFYVIPVIWGLAEGVFQTQSNSLIPILFPNKQEPAFANYHTWKAVGFTITFIYSYFICVSTKLFICLGLLVVGFALYVIIEVRIKMEERDKDRNEMSTVSKYTVKHVD